MLDKRKMFCKQEVEERIKAMAELDDEEKERLVTMLDSILMSYAHEKAEKEFSKTGESSPVAQIGDEELNEIIVNEFENLLGGMVDSTIYTRHPNKIRMTRKHLRKLVQEEVISWGQREVERLKNS